MYNRWLTAKKTLTQFVVSLAALVVFMAALILADPMAAHVLLRDVPGSFLLVPVLHAAAVALLDWRKHRDREES